MIYLYQLFNVFLLFCLLFLPLVGGELLYFFLVFVLHAWRGGSSLNTSISRVPRLLKDSSVKSCLARATHAFYIYCIFPTCNISTSPRVLPACFHRVLMCQLRKITNLKFLSILLLVICAILLPFLLLLHLRVEVGRCVAGFVCVCVSPPGCASEIQTTRTRTSTCYSSALRERRKGR